MTIDPAEEGRGGDVRPEKGAGEGKAASGGGNSPSEGLEAGRARSESPGPRPGSLPLFLTATPVLPHGHPSLGKPGGRRLLAALKGALTPNFSPFCVNTEL